MSKKEKEFWSKCLVTETRELDTSNFKNHFCSKKCTAPRIHTLKYSSTKKECLKNLTAFLKRVSINIKDVICINFQFKLNFVFNVNFCMDNSY